jgi:hypothetical protein
MVASDGGIVARVSNNYRIITLDFNEAFKVIATSKVKSRNKPAPEMFSMTIVGGADGGPSG